MKKIMIKTICAVVAVSTVILACSSNLLNFSFSENRINKIKFDKDGYWKTEDFWVKKSKNGESYSLYGANSLYGAYLAGRVAHLRQDFDTASEYYKIVMTKDPENLSINRYTYVILTSIGDIPNAAIYAQKEIDNGNNKSIAPLIVAIKDFSDANYDKVFNDIKLLDNQEVYKSIVNPLFRAWAYAGKNNETEAIKQIDSMINDKGLDSLKRFHKGMIYDYLGNKKKAGEYFSFIVKQRSNDVTFRMLEIITDFYVRIGEKDTAKKISNRYNDSTTLAILLEDINTKIKNTSTGDKAIISSPQKGLAEALFNIGTIFRISNGGAEYAQLYISSSAFLNPDYEVAKIALANILEENGLLKEANKYYATITEKSGSYFIAQLKMIENLDSMEQYDEAEDLLRKLIKDYPDNTQLLNNLGDIVRGMNKNTEAIKIYQKAVKSIKVPNSTNWPVFYSLGVSYDIDNQKDKAEEYLQKALLFSNRDPNVLNYLGYTWLIDNKNTDDAINMIVEAYRKMPYDGHIMDSLGWVYYKLGKLDKAIEYLEQASDMNPANAVISDHLGDAYWQIGRHNEAVFQWQHALVLKEDAELIKKEEIQNKIDGGINKITPLPINNPELQKLIDSLNVADERRINNSVKK